MKGPKSVSSRVALSTLINTSDTGDYQTCCTSASHLKRNLL